jgi:DNA-binding NtrC family response regulator
MAKHRILVVDDEALMREYVEEALLRAGHYIDGASTGQQAVDLLATRGYDIVITDLKMTPMNGLEVLRRARKLCPKAAVILMTAYGTIETAVTALKEGAADYILKPFTPDALELTVDRVLERRQIAEENQYLRQEVNSKFDIGAMVGMSPAMTEVYDRIKKVADSRATVLIRGESGTGKELVARAIHYSSNRREKPFVKVNCAALSAGILESELFGHEKGSFTGAHDRKYGRFELADQGTLLLDEVSEIGVELQPKLLRALQEREFERVGGTESIQVDTRIIATSNRALERAVSEGEFREDLFFRLNVIAIQLPPLRMRREDIPALMDYFLTRFTQENAKDIRGFSEGARRLFLDYPWPGNVRELQNAIERAVVLSSESLLEPDHFQLEHRAFRKTEAGPSLAPGTTVAEMERQLIFDTLTHCGQNRTKAAELLGISVRTLRNKLREYRETCDEDDED